MNATINYEKYENMSKRIIFNHLLKAEEKLEKMEQNYKNLLNNQKELVKFLRAKVKSKIDEKEIHEAIAEANEMRKYPENYRSYNSISELRTALEN